MNSKQYEIEWLKQAEKDLGRIREDVRGEILEKVEALAENPRPTRSKLIHRKKNLRRFRVGDYRVVYSVFDKRLKVIVVYVGDRKDIYRRIA